MDYLSTLRHFLKNEKRIGLRLYFG